MDHAWSAFLRSEGIREDEIGNVREVMNRAKIALGAVDFFDLAEKLNMSIGGVNSWRTQKRVPLKHLMRISKDGGVSLRWLLTGFDEDGQGNSDTKKETRKYLNTLKAHWEFRSDDELAQKLETKRANIDQWLYRGAIPEKWQLKIENILKEEGENGAIGHVSIRQLNTRVGAGECVEISGVEVCDSKISVPFSLKLFKTPPAKLNTLRCMQVEGHSMEPMLYPDSWVVAEISPDFSSDGLYIIEFDGAFMVKILQKSPLGKLEIISVNKEYESYTLDKESMQNVRIIGRVLRCIV